MVLVQWFRRYAERGGSPCEGALRESPACNIDPMADDAAYEDR